MKTTLRLTLFTFTFLLLSSYSLATPLNGTYTLGNGGNYPTIQSAFDDATAEGISGPVIFNVITGTYNENILIDLIPGSSILNTITLTSQTGNIADVVIIGTFRILSNNQIFKNLTFETTENIYIGNPVPGLGYNNITFSNDNFNDAQLISRQRISDIYLNENENIGSIFFQNDFFIIPSNVSNIQITNNSISGGIYLSSRNINTSDILIANNNINGRITINYGNNVLIKKNSIGDGIYGFGFFHRIYNNLVIGIVECSNALIFNNTIVGGTLTASTLGHQYFHSDGILNNIIINPSGGPALRSSDVIPFSDYNDFYNGGSNILIDYMGTTYNNVSDFSNATGLDQHSNSHSVTFFSPTDLHLAGSSIGDEALIGIPDTSITDDIDGEPRTQFFPYKGADENTDFPLPVELASFTSSVNNNNVTLNWTTSSEINNIGFDVERKHLNGEWFKINFISGHKNSNTIQLYTYEDKNLSPGNYKFRLKQIDFNGNFKYYNLSNEVIIGVPEKYSLSQNYPNPFNPSTIINYELPVTSYVSLKVYDAVGKLVATLVNENQNPGSYNYQFSTVNYQLSSGVYFYKLEAGDFSAVKKMFLMK